MGQIEPDGVYLVLQFVGKGDRVLGAFSTYDKALKALLGYRDAQARAGKLPQDWMAAFRISQYPLDELIP